MTTGKRLKTFSDGHKADVVGTAVTSDASFIAAVANGDMKLWDVRAEKAVLHFPSLGKTTWTIEPLPNRQTFGVGLDEGMVKLVDIRAVQDFATIKNELSFDAVHSLAFSQSGRMMFACFDKQLLAYDILTGAQSTVATFKDKISNGGGR